VSSDWCWTFLAVHLPIGDPRILEEIRVDIVARRKWTAVCCRLFQVKDDKEKIAAWISGLNRILGVFNVRSTIFAL